MKEHRTVLAVGLLLGLCGLARAGDGALEQRAMEVRAFVESVVGDLDVLIIPDDVSQLPQPTFNNGELRPEFITTPEKIELGKFLFHDPVISSQATAAGTELTASCATCHLHQSAFRAGLATSLGVGGLGLVDGEGQPRRTPILSLLDDELGPTPTVTFDSIDNPGILSLGILNSVYYDELTWSGSFFLAFETDLPPLERQVRAALENHRINADALRDIPAYVDLFAAAFPELADAPTDQLIDLFQIVRAVASYERTVLSNQSPWDAFLAGDNAAMTRAELDGAELFFGDANCYACHTGRGFESSTYHALGVAEHSLVADGEHDLGRSVVTNDPADDFKFRAVGIRGLKGAGPFFHGGSAATLEDVIRYKNAAIPDQDVPTLSPLFVPLNLTEQEIQDLTAFVRDALFDPNLERHVPTFVPSGLCFPNDDRVSRYDAACDVFGDFDGDGDVDLADFGQLQYCHSGDEFLASEDCLQLDRDGDERVGLADFAAFVEQVTGPE